MWRREAIPANWMLRLGVGRLLKAWRFPSVRSRSLAALHLLNLYGRSAYARSSVAHTPEHGIVLGTLVPEPLGKIPADQRADPLEIAYGQDLLSLLEAGLSLEQVAYLDAFLAEDRTRDIALRLAITAKAASARMRRFEAKLLEMYTGLTAGSRHHTDSETKANMVE